MKILISPVFLHIRVDTENCYFSLIGVWKRKKEREKKRKRWADCFSWEQWENDVSMISQKR